ncbi:polysaccharide pyruvyl transferase family protein [Panacibacter sp. DH6]|uniref:Polysaccharide pyruvyl transferase family protein n=1 Tax=Panacibacter microcysteis TaxID=2793269 RepID=A0A931EAY2_9BACT|nr:polysaccharide pyruvyl transferase family protein [Panacibacter microcysteis]MBG9377071.1 polysaccharide pyruvyl transferase family protein [Panacibacter microcysteis]
MRLTNKIINYYNIAYRTDHFPSWSELFLTRKKVFAYYGFLGDKNFGDELVFESAKELFHPHILLPVRKQMPLFVKLYKRFYRRKIAGLVIGGGTLIGPLWEREFFESLVANSIPVYMHGTGVHEKIACADGWKNILKGKVYGGVRGPLSINNIQPVFNKAKIAGDAAFGIFDTGAVTNKQPGSKKILINIGTHQVYNGQDKSRIYFEQFIGHLLNNGYEIHFLPLHSIDVKAGNELIQKFPAIQMLHIPAKFAEAVNIFRDYTFATGERLHFIVMAMLTGTPFISVNYAKKHEDLLESVLLSKAGLHPQHVSLEKMVEAFDNREQFNWKETTSQISRLKEMQHSEQQNFMAAV